MMLGQTCILWKRWGRLCCPVLSAEETGSRAAGEFPGSSLFQKAVGIVLQQYTRTTVVVLHMYYVLLLLLM